MVKRQAIEDVHQALAELRREVAALRAAVDEIARRDRERSLPARSESGHE
jgi:hypothetical protein